MWPAAAAGRSPPGVVSSRVTWVQACTGVATTKASQAAGRGGRRAARAATGRAVVGPGGAGSPGRRRRSPPTPRVGRRAAVSRPVVLPVSGGSCAAGAAVAPRRRVPRGPAEAEPRVSTTTTSSGSPEDPGVPLGDRPGMVVAHRRGSLCTRVAARLAMVHGPVCQARLGAGCTGMFRTPAWRRRLRAGGTDTRVPWESTGAPPCSTAELSTVRSASTPGLPVRRPGAAGARSPSSS